MSRAPAKLLPPEPPEPPDQTLSMEAGESTVVTDRNKFLPPKPLDRTCPIKAPEGIAVPPAPSVMALSHPLAAQGGGDGLPRLFTETAHGEHILLEWLIWEWKRRKKGMQPPQERQPPEPPDRSILSTADDMRVVKRAVTMAELVQKEWRTPTEETRSARPPSDPLDCAPHSANDGAGAAEIGTCSLEEGKGFKAIVEFQKGNFYDLMGQANDFHIIRFYCWNSSLDLLGQNPNFEEKCTEAFQTSNGQYLAKEMEQVFPLIFMSSVL